MARVDPSSDPEWITLGVPPKHKQVLSQTLPCCTTSDGERDRSQHGEAVALQLQRYDFSLSPQQADLHPVFPRGRM